MDSIEDKHGAAITPDCSVVYEGDDDFIMPTGSIAYVGSVDVEAGTATIFSERQESGKYRVIEWAGTERGTDLVLLNRADRTVGAIDDETMKRVDQHLGYWSKKSPPSEAGRRVSALLAEWQGLHHLDTNEMSKVDWSNSRHIVVRWTLGSLSTFDFFALTTLVFLAHDHCVRVEIAPLNFATVKLVFHPRARGGSMSSGHPTIEGALERWRAEHTFSFEEVKPSERAEASEVITP